MISRGLLAALLAFIFATEQGLVEARSLAHALELANVLQASSSLRDRSPARKAALLAQRGLRHTPPASSFGEQEQGEDKQIDPEKVDVWPGVLMASIAGASTVLGATVILFMPEGGPPPSAMAFSFSLAAGVMVAISVEMLLPSQPKLESEGKVTFTLKPIFCFSAGAICCALLCKLGDILQSSATASEGDADISKAEQDQKKKFRLAALLFVSLTLHNFPEGFAVAVSALSGLRLGITMCIAVAFHNIPEGIALAVSVYGATKSYGQSFLWTFLSGLTEPLGAICAMMLIRAYVTLTPELLNSLLTVVAGVMCYVALVELLPEAISTRCWPAIISGFIVGVVVMVLTHLAIESASEAGHLDRIQ